MGAGKLEIELKPLPDGILPGLLKLGPMVVSPLTERLMVQPDTGASPMIQGGGPDEYTIEI